MEPTHKPISSISTRGDEPWQESRYPDQHTQHVGAGDRQPGHEGNDSAGQEPRISPSQEVPLSDRNFPAQPIQSDPPYPQQHPTDDHQAYQDTQYYGINQGPVALEYVGQTEYSSAGPYANTNPYISPSGPYHGNQDPNDQSQLNSTSEAKGLGSLSPGEVLSDDSNNKLQKEVNPRDDDSHPRKGLAPWKWKITLLVSFIAAMVTGYDLSNTANIQAALYEAFGHVELLPVVTIGYSIAMSTILLLVRQLSDFINLKKILMVSAIIFAVGSAVCGAAKDTNVVIVGRVIQGLGGAGLAQCVGGILGVLSTPAELPLASAGYALFWVIGMMLGPIIGAAFTQNEHATWRWAFYILIPFNVFIFVMGYIAIPSIAVPPRRSFLANLATVDWLGLGLFTAFFVMISLTITFSGSTWPWDSSSAIVAWVFSVLLMVSFSLQQYFSILTAPDRRIFPWRTLSHRTVLLNCIAQGSNAGPYAVTLYYTPLLFAFAKGDSAIQSSVHMLPFICTFIVFVLLAGALLPVLRRYAAFFALSALLTIAGTAYIVTIDSSFSSASYMGASAVVGAGVAVMWPIAVSTNTLVLRGRPDSVQDTSVLNFQMVSLPSVLTLALAGCIFQNRGFRNLKEILGPLGFDDMTIRQALAGVDSPVWTSTQPGVQAHAIESLVHTIAQNFYLAMAGGIVMLIAALCMKWEALDFKGVEGGKASEGTREPDNGTELL